MKDQILKIAGVKSEKEFYKKFPTEKAFMAKHGKALKKAAMGKAMVAKQLTQLTDFANPPQAEIGAYMGGEQDVNNNVSFADIYDATDYQTTGMTNQMRNRVASTEAQQQMAANSANNNSNINKDVENIGKIANVAMMAMEKGGNVPKLQGGTGSGIPAGGSNLWGPNQPLMGSGIPAGAPNSPANPGAGMYPLQPGANPSNASIQQGFSYNPSGGGQGLGYGPGGQQGGGLLDTIASYVPGAEQLIGNFQQIKGAIKAREKSNQFVDLSRLSKEAAGTRGEISKRRYFEPKDMRFDQNQMNKPKGVGTEYLSLQDGGDVEGNPTEIQNTYAPNTIYTNLEYTPLRDTNIKQFQSGGFLDTFNNIITPGLNIATDLTTAIINSGTKKRNQQGFQNLGASALQQGAQQLQNQNSGFMEDGGYIEYPKAQAGTIADRSVGQFCGIQRGINRENARMNAEGARQMKGLERQASKDEKRAVKAATAALAGQTDLTHEFDESPLDKKVVNQMNTIRDKYLLDNPNVFVPDDTSGYTPQQKYALAIKLMDKGSRYTFNEAFQNQFGVPSKGIGSLERVHSELVPKMGGWEGVKNWLFNPIPLKYYNKKEDGGWVSNDWQPQTITQFGEHKMKDLLKPPYDADMLRAGGHIAQVGYTAPSERAMSTERPNFQMGGELQTHWGGYTEAASQNPYLPDGGVTYMPRGNYHSQSDGKGNTGIGITFGDNPVEVERGEPMVKLEDGGTGEKNLMVLGALDIPNYALADLNKNAKGKKFKTYGTELTKNTNKQNKMIGKATEELNDLEVLTPFDNLEMNSLQAQILGGNMKLKDIAAETQKLGKLQQAIHDTSEEFGYADVAKFNKDVKANRVQIGNSQPDNVQSAQSGGKFKVKGNEKYPLSYNPLGSAGNPLFTAGRYEKEWKPKVEKAFSDPESAKEIIKNIESYTGEGAEAAKKELAKLKTFEQKVERAKFLATDSKVGVYHDIMNNIIDKVTGKKRTPYVEDIPEYTPLTPVTVTSTMKKQPTIEEGEIPTEYDWQDIYNTVLPYVRPSNQLELDPTQLAGEMYALANNQVDPVFAQSYKPMLSTPFDISLQDQLNANQADYNATQRLVGYNPAALSQLNAQKYAANSAVLGQQTRLNQAEKARVYEANRNILNDAQLKNIDIYDQQMVRQSKALSNTKAQTQAALNSISDKYSKNLLENRTLGVYENLYNYRYDNRGRAINMNPLVDFQEMIDNASPTDLAVMKAELEKKAAKAKGKTARNGNVVKAIKNL